MINSTKPVFTEDDIWCSNPPGSSDLIRPDDYKISKGFRYGEIPKHNTFNWAGNLITTYAAHINKYGISEWDTNTSYDKGSVVLRGSSSSGREIYVAVDSNAGEDPAGGTNPHWRQFYTNLSDFKDVNLSSLSNGDVIQQIIYDTSNTLVPYYRMWENKPSKNILKIKELDDVFGSDVDGNILMKLNTTNNDDTWISVHSNYLMNYLSFEDYKDVENDPNNWNRGDVLTWEGGAWGGVPTEGYVEWDDILFKPDYFNPYQSKPEVIGGFRSDFRIESNNPILDLFTSPLAVPEPPQNVRCSFNNSSYVMINWDDAGAGIDPTNFLIYRNDKFLDEVNDSTLSYKDTTAEINKIYTYYILAKNAEGHSLKSNSSTGARTEILPGVGNLQASQNTSPTIITLYWTELEGAINYNIYKKKQGESSFKYVAGAGSQPFYYYDLPNTTSEFYIKAVNPNGDEGYQSNTVIGKTKSRSGNKIFKNNGTFNIPNGIEYLKVEMQGGGGSGAVGEEDGYHSGGGRAGEFISRIIDVKDVGLISVNTGNGGEITNFALAQNGSDGTTTQIIIHNNDGSSETINASGGKGGSKTSSYYNGNGNEKLSKVTGLFYHDGLHSSRPNLVSCYGGEASHFGNGGSRSGKPSGYGAGGSAVSKYEKTYDLPIYCNGGDGVVVLTWGGITPYGETEINESTGSTGSTINVETLSSDLGRDFGVGKDIKEIFHNKSINDFGKNYDKGN